ncbi:hypothetical protein BDY24DRAFT_382225 [Mrakia frigida]|uniref:Hua1p n=1 Tax=Mrakia frigida TaxID=29902 RepID=UPI003FCC1DDC
MASTSKNPFLSPSHTGSSERQHSPLPNINDAFTNLNISPSPAPSIPSSSRPNNPFLDAPQPSQPASRALSREEIQALEGPDGPASQPGWTGGGEGGGRGSKLVHASGSSTSRSREPSPPPRPRKEEGYDVPPSPTIVQQPSVAAASTSGAQQNGDYIDDQAALDAAIAASLGDAPPSSSSPPAPAASSSVFAPPPGPPPTLPARPAPPPRASSTEAPPAADPPPAYTPMGQQPAAGEIIVDVGPSRPAFTEREPRPFQQQQPQPTGGSWIEPQHTGWSDGGGNPGGFISPQSTGFRPPQGPPPSLPPRHPSISSRPPPPMQQNNSYGGGGNSNFQPPPQPPRPPQHSSQNSGPVDTTPSSLPIPGRPYLNDSRVLVYTPGFQCPKCLNTGYKFNDPTHPCRTCWKKYGRPFTSAMSLSWEQGVHGSSNWQRPLGVYHPPQVQNYGGNAYPGYGGQTGGYYRPDRPPPGAIVYQPGDPRIGGRPCYRCGGSGQILGFFENDTCQVCRGIGRVF